MLSNAWQQDWRDGLSLIKSQVNSCCFLFVAIAVYNVNDDDNDGQDPNRITWEQYKKENEEKLDLVGDDVRKMVEYRAQLDRDREERLRNGAKRSSGAVESSDDDSSGHSRSESSEGSEDRKHKKTKSKKSRKSKSSKEKKKKKKRRKDEAR